MSETQNHWERQKREIQACNIFYSAFHGIDGGATLSDLGFVSPARFTSIPIRGRTEDAEPDFATFNGTTLLLAEVKSGSNLSPRALRQMERCSAVTIEDGQNYISNSDYLTRLGFDHNDLATIEPCIVFIEDRYHSEIDQHYNQGDLSELAEDCVVMTQSQGGQLSVERGEFTDSALDSFLQSGINLPQIAPSAVYLNEGVEKESLAVSLCLDIVMPELKHGPVRLSTTQVDDVYPQRAIPAGHVNDVFDFLESIGACEHIEGGIYEFKPEDQREIFQVTDKVSNQRVDQHLHDLSEEQTGVDDFE